VASPAAPAPLAPAALPRVIGTRGFALAVINCVVGAGVFGLPALIAAELGRNALLALVLCAALIFCIALCFAEAATRVPAAGGYYAIAARAFGPFTGSVTGSLGWIANGAAGNAGVAALLLALLKPWFPVLDIPVVAFLAVALTYIGLAALNIRGVETALKVGGALGVAKLVPLALLSLALPFVLRADALPAAPFPPIGDLGSATVLMVFAFMGAEATLGVCGECKAPSRTIPRGLLMATAGIALLYGALMLTSASALGPRLVASGANALPEAATAVFGGWAGGLVSVTAAAAMASILVTDATCTPRVLFAMGRDGLIPRRFGLVHPRFGTPHVAVAVYAGVCGALAATGTFRQLAILASAGTLLLDLVIALAVLRLRHLGVQGEAPPFVVRGGPFVPILAVIVILGLLSTLTRGELLATGGLVVVAAGGYAMSRLGAGWKGPSDRPIFGPDQVS
jgi:amino acid transporter